MSNNDPSSSKKFDLVVTRVFEAPVAMVWKAWTEPELVMQWWGPDHFSSPSAVIDFREGGVSLVCMRPPKEFPGGDIYSTWTYRKIVFLECIEFVQNLADKEGNKLNPQSIGMPPDFPMDILTVVTFKEIGNKTEMTVTERDWTPGQMSGFAKTGLEQSLDKMVRRLTPGGV